LNTQTRYRILPWLLFFVVAVSDQITKAVVRETMHLRESISVIGSVVRLTYIHNPGGVFGLPLGGNSVFVFFSIVAVIFLLIYLLRMPAENRWTRAALALVMGGAVGNLIDRLRFGEVVDFLDVGISTTRWPVFNIADAGVTIGVALLFFSVFLKKES